MVGVGCGGGGGELHITSITHYLLMYIVKKKKNTQRTESDSRVAAFLVFCALLCGVVLLVVWLGCPLLLWKFWVQVKSKHTKEWI